MLACSEKLQIVFAVKTVPDSFPVLIRGDSGFRVPFVIDERIQNPVRGFFSEIRTDEAGIESAFITIGSSVA